MYLLYIYTSSKFKILPINVIYFNRYIIKKCIVLFLLLPTPLIIPPMGHYIPKFIILSINL